MDAPGFRLDHTPPYVGKEGQRADSINYLLPEDVYARGTGPGCMANCSLGYRGDVAASFTLVHVSTSR